MPANHPPGGFPSRILFPPGGAASCAHKRQPPCPAWVWPGAPTQMPYHPALAPTQWSLGDLTMAWGPQGPGSAYSPKKTGQGSARWVTQVQPSSGSLLPSTSLASAWDRHGKHLSAWLAAQKESSEWNLSSSAPQGQTNSQAEALVPVATPCSRPTAGQPEARGRRWQHRVVVVEPPMPWSGLSPAPPPAP